MSAAMRQGGAVAAAAAAQLKKTMSVATHRRQSASEGFCRSWDAQDSRDVITVNTPSEPSTRSATQQSHQQADERLTEKQQARLAEAALTKLPVQVLSKTCL